MKDLGNTSHAVRAQRHEAPDSLDFFPTPPWAVRAFCDFMDIDPMQGLIAWDPCCGQGHMAEPLQEFFDIVHASDIHDYGYGKVGDFLGDGMLEAWTPPGEIDWILFNPPFNKSAEFVERARERFPKAAVSMLIRTNWLESIDRYERFFRSPETRPHVICVSPERIPMHKGRYDPKGSSATSYSWFTWFEGTAPASTSTRWIPSGGRKKYFREADTLIGQEVKA